MAAAKVALLLSPFSFLELRESPGVHPLSGSEYANFCGAALGVPVAAVDKIGKWRSPVPGYPGSITDGEFPGSSDVARLVGKTTSADDSRPESDHRDRELHEERTAQSESAASERRWNAINAQR